MTVDLTAGIVRILKPSGRTAGAGFLVSDDGLIVTCAHVVAGALGIPEETAQTPAGTIPLVFPLLRSDPSLTAQVIRWQPESDVAGLKLLQEPSAKARPLSLVTTDDLWNHHFRAFGFPAGYTDGIWASGMLRGRTGAGWVQIEDVKEPGYRVQPGFSGTPIWDEQLSGVVGMVVAADADRVTKVAFMIPARTLLEAWPKLVDQSLEAGSLEHLQMQLARLETAQRQAPDLGRFELKIDALRDRIAAWDGRVESQRERIAEGLEEQRREMAKERARRRREKRLRVVGQPPLDVGDYFRDRERDLSRLSQLLAEPATRLVSVIGHGGMGKTALACKVLRDLERHRWPYTDQEVPADGIIYLSTRTAGISLERLFLDCAKLVGGDEQERLNAVWTNPQLGLQEKIARLLEALRDGRYVILLDNLEDLLDDQGKLTDDGLRLFFEHALIASQGTQLIVTSRVALAFRREVMRFDHQVKLLDGLPVEDGVAVLRELDPNGDYGLRNAPSEQLAEAVLLAHGVPRALEVIVGTLANDPFATLDEVMQTFYEQEDVVEALIKENYKRLDQDARRVIEALAVFRRPVPPLAVDYLLEPFAPGLDVPGVVRRLTRTNIVSVNRTAKTVTLHPIDQDYAYSQLPDETQTEASFTRQALERRAADYYVQLRTPRGTWESIEDLEPQLSEFEHRVRAGDYDRAGRVLSPIDFDYLSLWGHYGRLVEMRKRLLGHLAVPSLRAENVGRLGNLYHLMGQFDRTIEPYDEARSIARQAGDRQSEGVWLGHLGTAHRDLGQFREATRFYEQALAIAREVADRRNEGIWLNRLGLIHHFRGQFEQAIRLYADGLAIARRMSDPRSEELQLGYLGLAYQALGRTQESVALYKQALALSRRIGYLRHVVTWLTHLGNSYCSLNQAEEAIDLHKAALSIAAEINDTRAQSLSLLGLGRDMLHLEALDEAQRYCAEARDLNVPELSYQGALALGLTLLCQGDQASTEVFSDASTRCRALLDQTPDSYGPCYALATAQVGQVLSDQRWVEENERLALLVPVLKQYTLALQITAAPGIVRDASRDLELIQMAGIEGLEPMFELLEKAEWEPDLPEDLSNILEELI
jgi:tetratricopeptide (TPR) repeat protein